LHSLSIRSINLYSFHSSIQINQKKVLHEPYIGVVAVAEEEEAGVDGSGGDRRSRERQGLREFWDEK
jgi:hypothetical protein